MAKAKSLSQEQPSVETTPRQPDAETALLDDERPPRLPFPIVGMGASAGGLEAFNDFFNAMPASSGMAFVLIQHLPPGRDSMMVDLLSKRTSMPVAQVEDGTRVEANHVYVIRPGQTMTIRDGALHLGEPVEKPGHRHPVDDFFKSLAEEQRERAICIIMSGMGTNGTAGAQAIKAVGGICIAQDPDSAKFPAMPRSLVDSGQADFVLRPQDIPEVLVSYSSHPYTTGNLRPEPAVSDVLTILRARTRHDFGGYKKPTISRRIQRRMGLNQITKISDYARLLRQNASEVAALADDLMIHVTGFFRDTAAWESLRQRVIVPLVNERSGDASVRAWVTACSSGEEAYTLAMLVVETVEAAGKLLDIKIFATDTAGRSLAHARGGIYPAAIENDVTPERLARFFDKEDSKYRVKRELRDMVVFAPQNVLHDPPFSRLDICTCRNLLIYLEPPVQKRLLYLLHFGLREGGALMLGNNETASGAEDLFEPIDKKHRIFQRTGPSRHGAVDFPLPRMTSGTVGRAQSDTSSLSRASIAQITSKALLDRFTPASVVIDQQQSIVYFHGHTERYLDQPRGEPTRDLMTLVHESFRGAVRTALYKALGQHAPAMVHSGVIERPDGKVRVEVTVAPLELRSTAYFLISFRDHPELAADDKPPSVGEAERNRPLENELQRARDDLQSTVQELQTSNEEMRASNEEVLSINEELQSTNEELETSKEELQSLNEELTTVNTQLQAKMEELESTTNDLASLLSSTDIAVVFLDTELHVRRFTPAVKDLIDLIPSDVGRPLSDLARKFNDPHLLSDAQTVLDQLAARETEIVSQSGRSYLRRMLPYRTMDNRIGGVVITFVDITRRAVAEAELRSSEERYRLILEGVTEYAIFLLSPEGLISTWPEGATRAFGFSRDEAIGQPLSMLFLAEDHAAEEAEKQLDLARRTGTALDERWHIRKDGHRFWGSGALTAVKDSSGQTRGFVKVVRDNTDRKLSEEALKDAKQSAEAANEAKDQFLANVSHELRTPLSAMLLWVKMLEENAARDPAQVQEGIEAIRRSAESQKELIDDLLDTARISAGQLRLEIKETELGETVRSAVAAVRPAALAKGVDVLEELDPAIGTVRADAHRLQQVLWNLLSNAIKFTSAGGRVNVAALRFGDDVEIRVSDTGRGISAEFLPHVFDRFLQAEPSATRTRGGLGLGLTIAKQLVGLHGGSIAAHSAGVGRGSNFTVRLPMPAIKPEATAAGARGTRADEARPLENANVLLVEDNSETRNALIAALREMGAHVTAVESADAALAELKHHRPDVLVSDIGLLGKDGNELMRTIRFGEARHGSIPLRAIALTAFTSESDRRKSLQSGFQQYLTKPIETKALAAAIAALLPARRRRTRDAGNSSGRP